MPPVAAVTLASVCGARPHRGKTGCERAALDWLLPKGVIPDADGFARLYKVVQRNYRSRAGWRYTPGKWSTDDDMGLFVTHDPVLWMQRHFGDVVLDVIVHIDDFMRWDDNSVEDDNTTKIRTRALYVLGLSHDHQQRSK